MKRETFFMHMSDGKQIAVHRWLPDKKSTIRGIIQLSHGMNEYAMRYDGFAEFLTTAGFAVYGQDHRGHGETAGSPEELGYLADMAGFQRVVLDLRQVIKRAKNDFPGKKIFLFAHSFGSFIGQSFIEQYSYDIDGCILCGTAGPRQPLMAFAKFLAKTCILLGRKKKPAKLLAMISFAGYNQRFPESEGKNAWLTRDSEIAQKYAVDPMCNFVPKTMFYYDMFTGMHSIHKKKAMKAIPRSFPVFMIVGGDDPVGGYAKTVEKLYEIYKNNGMSDVELKVYPGGRHELLNETNKEEVMNDVLAWIDARM